MHLDLNRLAGMGRTGRASVTRLIPRTLDSDGTAVTIYLPTPSDLTACIVPTPGRELFKSVNSVSWREAGSDAAGDDLTVVPLAAVIDAVEHLLGALPEAHSTGAAYDSIRHIAAHRRDLLRDLAERTARQYRLTLPDAPKPPKVERPKRAPSTTAERMRRMRARHRDEAKSSAMWALSRVIEDAEPGSKMRGDELQEHSDALISDALEDFNSAMTLPADEAEAEWQGARDDEGYPPRPRLASKRLLVRVASEDFGLRVTRPKNLVTLHMPKNDERDTTMKNNAAMYEELLDRMALVYAEDYREGFEDYLATRSVETEQTGTARRHLRAI